MRPVHAPLTATLAMLAACSFTPAGGGGGGAADATTGTNADAATSRADAAPTIDGAPVDCQGLTCSPDSSCNRDGPAPVCVCNAGFTGDGITCADVDECATTDPCPAACANTVGSFTCYVPATCDELAAHGAGDGSYTLYVGGDLGKPWTASCVDMGTPTPSEYLAVPAASNFGEYESGGAASGTTVLTEYDAIRIDPIALVIDVNDQRFAMSSGPLQHPNTPNPISVTAMPLGVAMLCNTSGSTYADAEIDLRGTPFVIASGFSNGGNNARGTSNLTSNAQHLTLTGGGYCGWRGPSNAPANPFNQNGGPGITIQYAPP